MTTSAAVTRTILIATAAAGVRDRFAHALQQAGHRTLAAADTGALVDALGVGRRVDLLLLDMRLSDGPALVAQIHEQAPALPVVVFSGSIASGGEVRVLVSLGVAGYVNEHSNPHHIVPALAPHLFPDSFNRRSSPRIVLAVPVSYRVGHTIAGAVTLNIGQGGLAVRTMNPLEISTGLHTRFRLPGSLQDIDAESRVMWRDRRVGMGLQFEQMTADHQAEIDEYVNRRHSPPSDIDEP